MAPAGATDIALRQYCIVPQEAASRDTHAHWLLDCIVRASYISIVSDPPAFVIHDLVVGTRADSGEGMSGPTEPPVRRTAESSIAFILESSKLSYGTSRGQARSPRYILRCILEVLRLLNKYS